MFQIVFNHPEYLWFLIALPLIILLHFLVLRFIKRKAFRFANFETMQRVVEINAKGVRKRQKLSKNLGLLTLRLFVLFLLIAALSDISIKYFANVSTNSYIIAIDNSGSMLANDYQPNRLSAAKTAAKTFIDSLNSKSYVSVVSFAGYPKVIINPSKDYDKIKKAIDSIEVSSEGGTDIASAIIMSAYLLKDRELQGDIIILTDGQTNIGAPIQDAMKIASENDIPVYTIGIGTKKGGSFMKGGLSKLDEELLKKIAEYTHGKYFKSTTNEELKKSFAGIDRYKKSLVFFDLSPYILFFALLLIFIEWGLINTRYRTIP